MKDVDAIFFLFLFLFFNADIVLSDKLVLYDLENQTIGWTQYNCEYTLYNLCVLLSLIFPNFPL